MPKSFPTFPEGLVATKCNECRIAYKDQRPSCGACGTPTFSCVVFNVADKPTYDINRARADLGLQPIV